MTTKNNNNGKVFMNQKYNIVLDNVRYVKNEGILFKEEQIFAMFLKFGKETFGAIYNKPACLDFKTELKFNKVIKMIKKVPDKEIKTNLLDWFDDIKVSFDKQEKLFQDISSNIYNNTPMKLFRASEIGKPYNLSGAKVNMILQLEDILIKTKEGYNLTKDYQHIGQMVYVDVRDSQGNVLKKKNYIVYNNKGKDLIEKLIKKYDKIK